jgi:hypothetical protein
VGNQKRAAVSQKEKYRLWWEFLQIARTDKETGRDVEWDKYRAWGNVEQYKNFESWWQDKGRFLQQPVVREVTSIPSPPPKHTLYLEVPLNRAPSRLAKRARHIIAKQFDKLHPELRQSRRKTASFQSDSGFTPNRDIRMAFYRQLLGLYHAVLKKHPSLRGVELLKACNAYDMKMTKWEEGHPRKKKRYRINATYTTHHRHGLFSLKSTEEAWTDWRDPIVQGVLRSLFRAQKQLDAVLQAVARGEFPGSA